MELPKEEIEYWSKATKQLISEIRKNLLQGLTAEIQKIEEAKQ